MFRSTRHWKMISTLLIWFVCATSASVIVAASPEGISVPAAEVGFEAMAAEAIVDRDVAWLPIDIDDVDGVIANRAGVLKVEVRLRRIEDGTTVALDEASRIVSRDEASYAPQVGLLVVKGRTATGKPAIEDTRLVEHDGTLWVLIDSYLAPLGESGFVGRSIPQPLAADTAVKNALLAPSISGINGVSVSASEIVSGKLQASCGKTLNGAFVLNYDPANPLGSGLLPLTISGTNFGTSTGTVTIASRVAKVLSWSSTKIVVDPTVPYNAAPLSTTLRITPMSSASSATFGISTVPAIRGRVFGQCTQWVARTRIDLGKLISPTAYSGYSQISGDWVPRVGDQLKWLDRHQAIITSISGPTTSGNDRSWSLTITEANARCDNRVSSYSATFTSRATLSGRIVVTYPRSTTSSFGGALDFYR